MKNWFLLSKQKLIKNIKKIIDATENFNVPNFNKEKSSKKLFKKSTDKKVRKLLPNWVYAARSLCIVLLLSTVYYLTSSARETLLQHSFGEQLALVLPDGSEVLLNSKSSITL